MKPTTSQTPIRDALIAKARECPRCTIIERKPGQAIATFLGPEELKRVKRALDTK
jgi:hypothetical protein